MKPYRIDHDTMTFKNFLTAEGIKWEIVEDYVGILVYLECDTDLLRLGMDYARSQDMAGTVNIKTK